SLADRAAGAASPLDPSARQWQDALHNLPALRAGRGRNIMQVEQLRQCLDSADQARCLLQNWQIRDTGRGIQNLTYLASHLGVDALRDLCTPLARLLPRCPDADMALNNLERFLAQPAARDALPNLLETRARTLEILIQLFSNSQSFSDLLV